MANEVTKPLTSDIMEKVLLSGNLVELTADQRLSYYKQVCESVGLNPLTQPFMYITLNGKLKLYASRDATDQLRKVHGVSIEKLEREVTEGTYVVTAYAKDKAGRTDTSVGAVPLENLRGEARANALMKCETKAKRRVTLSICGLGMLDETEVDSIPGAKLGETQPAPETHVHLPGIHPPLHPPQPKLALVDQAAVTVVDTTEAQATPVDPVEVKGSTPITAETKASLFKTVPKVNKKHGAGVAQKLILELHPDGRQLGMLSEEEGQALLAALQKGLE